MKFLRYVFYRLYKQQAKVLRDRTEAAISTIIFMSITPMALLTLIDMLIAAHFGSASLFEVLGRWVFGLLAFGAVFSTHYFLIIKVIGLPSIEREFGSSAHAVMGGLAVFAYLFLPALVTAVVASRLA